MVLADPIVFAVRRPGGGALSHWKPFFFTAIGEAVLAIVAPCTLARRSAVVAGVLGGTATLAIAPGIRILPYSVMGLLLYGLGALGLTPFLCAAALPRRSEQLFGRSSPRRRMPRFCSAFALVLVSCVAVQVLSATWLRSRIQGMTSPSSEVRTASVRSVARWRWLLDLGAVAAARNNEADPTRKAWLAEATRKLVAEDTRPLVVDLDDEGSGSDDEDRDRYTADESRLDPDGAWTGLWWLLDGCGSTWPWGS